ncbi:hypothetical protein C7E12_21290, partial [Stenotrophomonas maltophilia]
MLSLIDRLPTKDRPVGPAEFAGAMRQDDYLKVREYIKLGDARLQGILALASAVLSLIDRLPTKDRPVGPAEFAGAMRQD